MRLYIDSKQRGKAILTAKKIVSFKVKIESAATRQIRQEAKDYIRHMQ